MTSRHSEPVFYEEVCDASGAVPVDPNDSKDNRFFVADDEDADAVIRVYDAAKGGPPVKRLTLSKEKLMIAEDEELDWEAAARIGDRIYWIGSHSRDKKGKRAHGRRRLIGTRISVQNGEIDLKISGQPYSTLLADAESFIADKLPGLNLDPKVPPKEGGLSIEGLAADPETGALLIGLRSPLHKRKALMLTLLNPHEVTAEDPKPAQFGEPELLDLGGLGIRSLEYWPRKKRLLILAGPPGKGSEFRMYSWTPGAAPTPLEFVDFAKLDLPDGVAPEGFFLRASRMLILFDEGNRQVNGKKNKKSKRPTFRSITVQGLR